ncbi:hypothetical protein DCC85_17870 [Paenibacillus sp. CAA11]|nr:hypothetical protein DCC85_17870 [Paenibacillus sp. CAA11]
MTLNKRKRRVLNGARILREFPELTFEQAFDSVSSAKRAEGLRPRSLKDYEKHYGYFIEWLCGAYPELQ